MLQNIKELYGNQLAASDGEIGKIKDFYFDDQRWAVRYLVAETGPWLTDRLVLVSPHAFGKLDRDKKQLHVNLTRAQIEKSPPIETHRPVSRQYEQDYYTYYGWPTYWSGDLMWGATGFPLVNPAPPETPPHHGHNQRDDLHLRSTKAVKGYDIQATDGSIGSVSGFMVDDKSWAVGEVVAETGHWYSGKEILISPSKITRISYEESKVFVNLTQADIRRTAENDIAKAGV
ncbi:MAG TPA: PRC-barrel domain-containing protein [Rariglobus sp.]